MSDTLGRTLETTRIRLGKSLSDAEGVTFIRARMLAALEAGDWEALPDPAYVRGYIQNYAKFLQLDPAPLLAMYERESGTTATRAPIYRHEPVVTPRSQRHSLPPRTALFIVLIIGLLALSVFGIMRLTSDAEPPPPLPSPTEPSPDTTEPTTTPGVSTPSGEPTETLTDPQTGTEVVPGQFAVRVVIAEDSSSWLRVTVDGLNAYEGTMAGGQTREWFVEDEASIRVGRPSAVTISRDGQTVEIPAGDPPTVTLTAE